MRTNHGGLIQEIWGFPISENGDLWDHRLGVHHISERGQVIGI
jgi:hypothetical protein